MVNSLLTPSSGDVRFETGGCRVGPDPVAPPHRLRDPGRRAVPAFTVARNIGLVPELEAWPAQKIRARVDELLDAVGLAPDIYAARYPRQLSGGEKQRVGIARALAADPPLLLLDEPFAALDPVTRYDMQRHFLKLRKEFDKAALFVTHDLREALLLGSRIALLHEGRVEWVGPSGEFLQAPSPHAQTFLRTLELERAR
jgi:osmoprotectant transport system ATP-binding protein